MKIAIFSDNFYPELSGVSDTILLTGQELARLGHSVDYFVPKYSKANYITGGLKKKEINLGPNVRIHRLFSFPYHGPTKQSRIVLPKFWHGLWNKKQYDIIHSNQIFGAGLEAICLARWQKIPLIGTNHNLIESFIHYSPINSRLIKKIMGRYVVWYFEKCNLTTTPSQFLLSDMKAKNFSGQGSVVSNPIDKAFFSSTSNLSELRKSFGLDQEDFVVLYVGRLAPEKNVESLIEAFTSFSCDKMDVKLIMVGQGSLRSKLEKKIKQNNWGDKVKIVGPFLGGNKQKLYDAFLIADVFAMPSTSEIQSMGTLQAMVNGLPIMAAKAGGMPELVGDDRGLLHEPDNIKEINECLSKLYKEKGLRKNLGENARQYARQFSASSIAEQWEKIYNQVIADYQNKNQPNHE